MSTAEYRVVQKNDISNYFRTISVGLSLRLEIF